MSKHTLGPWEVVRASGRISVWTHSQAHICDVAKRKIYEGQIETQANACLIAAAPELLEALEFIMKNDGDDYNLDHHACEIALAAIAKAKGEDQ